MAARKYTEQEMRDALIRRRAVNKNRRILKRQADLFSKFLSGDANIEQCVCEKYFNTKVHLAKYPDAKRKFCTKCPMGPLTKVRKYFKKMTQEWGYYEVKR